MFGLFNKCSVFISHKRNEGKVSFDATWFESALLEKGFKVFMDVHEDYIGNFPKVLAEKVKSSNVFLLVLPSDRDLNYLCDEKNWVHKEILYALRKVEYDEKLIRILPVSFKNNITFPPKEKLGEIAAISDFSILYCDINDQERSKQKLYKAIGYKSCKFSYTWKTIIFLILCLLVGLFMKKELMPNILFDDEDAVALFELANKQSANNENVKAMNSYKKVKDYWETQNEYTRNYFHSYFMYLELSRDFMEGHDLVSEYKNIINGIEQNVKFEFLSESDAIDYNQIKMNTEFELGYDYFYKLHNLDSAWHYMKQTEQYFVETKDSAKLKEIDKIRRKWTIKYYKAPELVETNKSQTIEKKADNSNLLVFNQNKAQKEIEKTTANTIKKEYPHIKDLLQNTKSCRTGTFNEKGDGVIIWGRNSYACTIGVPKDMKNILEKIKNDNEYINDVYINNNQEWCIVWGTNSYETTNPSPYFNNSIEKYKRENRILSSIAFNDKGQYAILANNTFICSDEITKQFIEKAYSLYGFPSSISMTNTSMVVCCEKGVHTKGLSLQTSDIIKNNSNYNKTIRFTDNENYLLTDGLREFTHNFK